MQLSYWSIIKMAFKNPLLLFRNPYLFNTAFCEQLEVPIHQSLQILAAKPDSETKTLLQQMLSAAQTLLRNAKQLTIRQIVSGQLESVLLSGIDINQLESQLEKVFLTISTKAYIDFQEWYESKIDAIEDAVEQQRHREFYAQTKSDMQRVLTELFEPHTEMTFAERWQWRFRALTHKDSLLYGLRPHLMAEISKEPAILENLLLITETVSDILHHPTIQNLLALPMSRRRAEPLKLVFDAIKPIVGEGLHGILKASNFNEEEGEELLDDVLDIILDLSTLPAEAAELASLLRILSETKPVQTQPRTDKKFYLYLQTIETVYPAIQETVDALKEIPSPFLRALLLPGVKLLSGYTLAYDELSEPKPLLTEPQQSLQREILSDKIDVLSVYLKLAARSPVLEILQENPNQILCAVFQKRYAHDIRGFLNMAPDWIRGALYQVGIDAEMVLSKTLETEQQAQDAPIAIIRDGETHPHAALEKMTQLLRQIPLIPYYFMKIGFYVKLLFSILIHKDAKIFDPNQIDLLIEQINLIQENINHQSGPFAEALSAGLQFAREALLHIKTMPIQSVIGLYFSSDARKAFLEAKSQNMPITLSQFLARFVEKSAIWMNAVLQSTLHTTLPEISDDPMVALAQIEDYLVSSKLDHKRIIMLLVSHMLKENDGHAFFQLLNGIAEISHTLKPVQTETGWNWTILSQRVAKYIRDFQIGYTEKIQAGIEDTAYMLIMLSQIAQAAQALIHVLDPRFGHAATEHSMEALSQQIEQAWSSLGERPLTALDNKIETLLEATLPFMEWVDAVQLSEAEKAFANDIFTPLIQLSLALRGQVEHLPSDKAAHLETYLHRMLDGMILLVKNPVSLKLHENPIGILREALALHRDYRQLCAAMPEGIHQVLSLFLDESLIVLLRDTHLKLKKDTPLSHASLSTPLRDTHPGQEIKKDTPFCTKDTPLLQDVAEEVFSFLDRSIVHREIGGNPRTQPLPFFSEMELTFRPF